MANVKQSGPKDLLITCVKGDENFLKFFALPLNNNVGLVNAFEQHFAKITNELDRSPGFSNSTQVPAGCRVGVRSKIKQQWCRATVTRGMNNMEVLVQLMDYGDDEVVSVYDVRIIDDNFFCSPPQALECILADVVPVAKRLREAVLFCNQHLLTKTVTCYVISHYYKIPVVRIALQGELKPFVQRLIDNGLAFIKQESQVSLPPPIQQIPQQPIVTQILPTRSPPPPQVMSYTRSTLPVGSVCLVKVSFIENLQNLHVQLCSSESKLKELMSELKSYCANETLMPLQLPMINTPCLAQFSAKQQVYYRGVIISILQGRCQVLFVDYGCIEVKEYHELKAIPVQFLGLNTQAICCSLVNAVELDPSDFFHVAKEGTIFRCQVLSYDGHCHLVRLDRVQTSYRPAEELGLNKGFEMTVSYINDISEFFCQMVHSKKDLDVISQLLNSSSYQHEPVHLADCTPNHPVCAKFSEDHQWYRGKVIKVNHENDIEIFFVDFGNSDNASIKDLSKLTPELLELPAQAYKCCLFDLESPEDSVTRDEMFECFEELVNDQALRAEIRSISSEQTYAVSLYEKNSQITINEKIQMKFSKVKSVAISTYEKLFITFFTSPTEFFGQFEKLSSEQLDEMMAQLNEFYNGMRNTIFKPTVGSFVCVRFSEDGSFYRALVQEAFPLTVKVLFIDYGNRVSVPIQDVHPLNAAFMKLPAFGVECCLENCPPATPVEKMGGLMMDNSVEAKMLKEVNGKWIISLVEDCAANVAVLELMRQHERFVPRSAQGSGMQTYLDPQAQSFKSNIPDAYKLNHMSTPTLNSQGDFDRSLDAISVPLKAYRNVYVSHAVDPSEFYCQLEEDSPKLTNMMSEIENVYTNISGDALKLPRLNVGTVCCAVFEEDGGWYRAQIKKPGASSSSVLFIDYGNTDSVTNVKIKQLQPQFFTLPSQAIRCKSHNVTPKGGSWTSEAIDAFLEMTLDKSFVAQFVEVNNSGTYSVNLVPIDKLENEILNKEFANLGQRSPRRNAPTPDYNSPPKASVAQKTYVPEQQVSRSAPSHVPSKKSTFQSLSISNGSNEAVIITFGLNPSEIFCQLKSNEHEFQQMMTKLQDYYNKVSSYDSGIDRPQQGMICVAQFYQDNAWYRGEIKKIGQNSLSVLYVDYGNCEDVSKNSIRSITDSFMSLPMQALKCKIKGVKPVGQSWPSGDNFSKYYEGDARCHFLSKEADYHLIDLTCNQKNVGERLIADGIALGEGQVKTAPKAAMVLPQRSPPFMLNQLLSVAVSFVESPSKFWCQNSDDTATLDQLMADIEVSYQDVAPTNSLNLAVGDYCVAKYSADNGWYRAQVRSCSNGYEVFFIDYGNSETTTLDQLAPIKPEFLKTPALCFECSLVGSPRSCTQETIDAFQTVTESVDELTAKVEKITKPNLLTVTLLYEKDGGEVNVSQELFGSTQDTADGAKDSPKFLLPDIILGPQEAYVTEVISPHDFFIQLASCEDALTNLSTELSESYSEESSDNVLKDPFVGCACAAKYSEDDKWYRAEVLKIDGDSAEVLFVDYGNTSTVSTESLKLLSLSFLEVPPYAIRCKLNGIAPTGDQWAEVAITSFQEMVADELLSITFISKDLPAVVNILKEDKDIGQSLIDSELASVESCPETEEAYTDDHLTTVEDQLHSLPSGLSYPKRKLASSKLKAKICFADSHDKFYVMPLELSTELDTIMKTLEILYSSESNDLSKAELEDPSASMPCVAKYSEDESWYRAIITEIESKDITVNFVDYGNSEVTTLQNLKPLTPELFKIPPICIECKLHGIEAVEGKEAEIAAKLEELCLDEIELDMEVVKFNEVYEVKLCHEEDLAQTFCKTGLAVEVEHLEEVLLVETLGKGITHELKTAFVELSEDTANTVALKYLHPDAEATVSVKFVAVQNHIIVYAVPVELEEELENFQDRLQAVYNEVERNVSQTNVKDFCVAKYAEDELWYRAQILKQNDDELEVQFIDYGNVETVTVNDINELLPEFKSKPQFCVRICLWGLEINLEKSDELQEKLDEILFSDTVIAKTCQFSHSPLNTCVTNLVCGENLIVEMLLNENYVSQKFIVHSEIEEQFEATVENVLSDKFYMLPVKLSSDLITLQNDVHKSCSNLSLQAVDKVEVSRLYATKMDEKWRRALISEANDTKIVAQLVDYGTEKEVELSQLSLLPFNLCHRPLVLQPCLVLNSDLISPDPNLEIKPEDSKKTYQCELQNTEHLKYPLEIKMFEKSVFSKLEEVTSEPLTEETTELQDEMKETLEAKDDSKEALPSGSSEVIADNSATEGPTEKEETEEVDEIITETIQAETEPVIVDSNEKISSDTTATVDESTKQAENNEDIFLSDEENTATKLEESEDTVKLVEESQNVVSPDDGQQLESPEDCQLAEHDTEDSKQIEECPEDNQHSKNGPEDQIDESLDDSQQAEDSPEDMQHVENSSEGSRQVDESPEDSQQVEDSSEGSRQVDESPEDSQQVEDSCQVEDSPEDCLQVVDSCQVEDSPEDCLQIEDSPEDCRPVEDSPEDCQQIEDSPEDCREIEDSPEDCQVEDSPEDCQQNEETPSASLTEGKQRSSEYNQEETYTSDSDLTENSLKNSNDTLKKVIEPESDEQFSEKVPSENGVSTLSESDACFKIGSDSVHPVVESAADAEEGGEEEQALPTANNVPSEADVQAVEEKASLPESSGVTLPSDNDFDERPECDIKRDNGVAVDENSMDLEEPLDNECVSLKAESEEVIEDTPLSNGTVAAVVSTGEKSAEETALQSSIPMAHLSIGKVDVHVSEVAISNGLIILAVTPIVLYAELNSTFSKELHADYSKEESNVSELVPETVCAVLSDGLWQRAKIMEAHEEEITVMLIDYGLVKTVSKSEVKELKAKHKNIPSYVVWCTLINLYCPSENSEKAILFIKNLLSDTLSKEKSISVNVLANDEPLKVHLLLDSANIAQQLLSEKFAIQQLDDPTISSGQYSALVSHFNRVQETPTLYIHLVNQRKEFETLKKSMAETYSSQESNVEVEANMYYAVKHNGCWLRAKAMSHHEDTVLFLVDTGEMIGTQAQISLLSLEHCVEAPFAFPCRIPEEIAQNELVFNAFCNVCSMEGFPIVLESDQESKGLIASVDKDKLVQIMSDAMDVEDC